MVLYLSYHPKTPILGTFKFLFFSLSNIFRKVQF